MGIALAGFYQFTPTIAIDHVTVADSKLIEFRAAEGFNQFNRLALSGCHWDPPALKVPL